MDSSYPLYLQRFTKQYLKKYLDPSSFSILLSEAQTMNKELLEGNWKFKISREDPLIFKKKGSDLQVDINCNIEGRGNNIKKHSVELTVWSITGDNREPRFKFHIDKKVPETLEPWHHLHIGEHDEPRFPFPPMDVILLCEFVLINYFQEDSENLRKDRGWKELVIYSQHIFQKEYFQKCRNCIETNNDSTLMEHLLNYQEEIF